MYSCFVKHVYILYMFCGIYIICAYVCAKFLFSFFSHCLSCVLLPAILKLTSNML